MLNFKQQTQAAYDKIAEEYAQRNASPFWPEEFIAFQKLLTGKKILDIGCGAGRDAEMMTQAGLDCVGIDFSEGMLKQARQRVKDGNFRQMDFYNLDFLDNSFDAFWASASFLHVPKNEIKLVLNEAKRILKPGGFGLVAVKEKTDTEEKLIRQEKYGGIARYFAFYTQTEFADILKQCGFKINNFYIKIENDPLKTRWLCFVVKK